MASWRIRFHDKWPHLASLYASTHNLDEEGKYPDPIMGQDNVFDPSEPYGAYRYYIQPTARSEFSLEEPTYVNRPVYKDEESRSSDYTSGASLKRGSTCRVLLCVFLVLSFIGVVVAAVTLAVLLSKTPRSSKITKAPIEEYESMASLLGRTFNETLLDKSSDDFKQLEKELCIALEQIFKDHDSPVKHEFAGCEVIEFVEGSVLARFRIKLQPKLPGGFKQELRIRQKIEEHFARKIKEHGPWQSVKFNPNFIRRFVKIEPPKVETSPPTTMSTVKVTTPTETMRPRLINDTSKPITFRVMTTEAELTTTNKTITQDATTMQATKMSDSTAEIDATTIMTKVTEISKTTEISGVQTTISVSKITESTQTVSDTVTQVAEVPTVSKVTESSVINMTVPETVTGVTKESKITPSFETDKNATTTTIDPFLFFENMTFPFNESSSTEELTETLENITKSDEITAATVDSGIITTTAKSTTLQSVTSSIDVGSTAMDVTDMTQASFTQAEPIETTKALVENATSASASGTTQTGATTEHARDQTVTQVSPTSDTDSTPIRATTISVSKKTTDFLIDSTHVPEMKTSVKAIPDIATVITTTITSTSLGMITEGLPTTFTVDTMKHIDVTTNETTLTTTDSIITVEDRTTFPESTDAPIMDTTMKSVITSSVQDKVTPASELTTASISTTQTIQEISTIAEASNMTNVTEPIFDFFETSTVENATEPDMVFITETTNKTSTTVDHVVAKSTTSTKGITQTTTTTITETTDSAFMTTIPQQDVNDTTTSQEIFTTDSIPTTLGADTLTFESLIPVQTQNLTTDILTLTTTNATNEIIPTTKVMNETIQRETVATFDSAPQTFIMPDVTLGTTTTTEGPTTKTLKTTTMTIATESNLTTTGVEVATVADTTKQMEFLVAAEDILIPDTTARDISTSQEASTVAISTNETSFTTVLTDATQVGNSSETATPITKITAEQTSESYVTTSRPETTSATEKPTTVSDMFTLIITSMSQTKVQNVTTLDMFENTTAPEMMTTASDVFNDTFQTDPYIDNMTITEVFMTTTTSPRYLTTITDSLTAQTIEQTSVGVSVMATDRTATLSTKMVMKQDNTTDTVPDLATTDGVQFSTGQKAQSVTQSTEVTQTTVDKMSTMLTTGQDSVTTEALMNETQTTSQPPSQTTGVDTVTSLNMTLDFTTEEIQLDNVTSTELMDFLNFTTTATQPDQTTSVHLATSTSVSNETTFSSPSSAENETTVFLDTIISPEQTTPTTLEADVTTFPLNESAATPTIADDSFMTADSFTLSPQITESVSTLNTTQAVSTDSISTADSITQSPQVTETATTLNATDTAISDSITTAATITQSLQVTESASTPYVTDSTITTSASITQSPQATETAFTVNVTDSTITTAASITQSLDTTETGNTVSQTVTEMMLSTDASGTVATEKLTQEATATPFVTGQAGTTPVNLTTESFTDDTAQTTQQTKIATTVNQSDITIKPMNESIDTTVTTAVEMATDPLLNFTDVMFNFSDTYENVTDGFVTDVITTTIISLTDDSKMMNATFAAEQAQTTLTSTTEQLTTKDTLIQTTKSPSANTTIETLVTTHTVNITDASFVDDNITIATEPTQATIQSNVTESAENITGESFSTDQSFNMTASPSADINATLTEEFTTQETIHSNITTIHSINITTENLTAQEPSNFTSAPSSANNMSDMFNATESPIYDNSTLIYDMTYDNTTDYYYLNETITSANPNETVSNYTTVLTTDITVSNVTEGLFLSNNDTNSSSDALTGAMAMSNESILPVS